MIEIIAGRPVTKPDYTRTEKATAFAAATSALCFLIGVVVVLVGKAAGLI